MPQSRYNDGQQHVVTNGELMLIIEDHGREWSCTIYWAGWNEETEDCFPDVRITTKGAKWSEGQPEELFQKIEKVEHARYELAGQGQTAYIIGLTDDLRALQF